MIDLHRIADMYGLTVQVEAYDSSATDGGGNPVPGYGAPFDVIRCVFDPGTSYEPVANAGAGSLRVITTPTVFLPAGSPAVGDKDRVTVPGNGVFEVDGEQRIWPAGTVVTLKRVDG